MDLWKRDLHTGMVGDAEVVGAAREVRASRAGEDEDKALSRSYHYTVLSGKLRQAIRRATDREGGRFLLMDD